MMCYNHSADGQQNDSGQRAVLFPVSISKTHYLEDDGCLFMEAR